MILVAGDVEGVVDEGDEEAVATGQREAGKWQW